jgi:hypothetical protein
MRHSSQGRRRRQVDFFRGYFLQEGCPTFSEILSTPCVAKAINESELPERTEYSCRSWRSGFSWLESSVPIAQAGRQALDCPSISALSCDVQLVARMSRNHACVIFSRPHDFGRA